MGSADIETLNGIDYNKEDFGKNLKILPGNDQIKELQTILRDKLVIYSPQQYKSCIKLDLLLQKHHKK